MCPPTWSILAESTHFCWLDPFNRSIHPISPSAHLRRARQQKASASEPTCCEPTHREPDRRKPGLGKQGLRKCLRHKPPAVSQGAIYPIARQPSMSQSQQALLNTLNRGDSCKLHHLRGSVACRRSLFLSACCHCFVLLHGKTHCHAGDPTSLLDLTLLTVVTKLELQLKVYKCLHT
jgi:hypothetical protein